MYTSDRLTQWLSRLVQIPSVGPLNAGPRSGPCDESRYAAQVAGWFREFGAEVYTDEVFPGRSNVYGIWHANSDRWIALDVHMDTVGIETMQGDPFDGRVEDGRVYGRGSVDTKASLAVALTILESLHQQRRAIDANFILCATADEETGEGGGEVFARWIRAQGIQLDQLMVAEPTLCQPVYGHKGAASLEFEIHGVAAHSSRPELGKNAIVAAAALINALDAERARLTALPPSTEVGAPTLTVSMIKGGQAKNIVPDRCTLTVDRRISPGEDPQQEAARLKALAERVCPLPFEMRLVHALHAFYQPGDTPWIRQLAEWAGAEPTVVPFGTNASRYDKLARECVILGPGSIDQAHRDVEWVAVSELEKVASIYLKWWGLTS